MLCPVVLKTTIVSPFVWSPSKISRSVKMLRTFVLPLAVTALAGLTTAAINESAFAPEDIYTRDVAIIGGGASGTYAAVRLREDYNVSIVVVEAQDHLVCFGHLASNLL